MDFSLAFEFFLIADLVLRGRSCFSFFKWILCGVTKITLPKGSGVGRGPQMLVLVGVIRHVIFSVLLYKRRDFAWC